MPAGTPGSARHSSSTAARQKKQPAEPRPSASIILLSPTNQVLLLHRVQTSSAYPSAHVFPGGNLSAFHDGEIPPPGDAGRHADSLPYRLGAIRETFEESGILLARDLSAGDDALLNLPGADRDEARRTIYENKERFVDWVERVGGVVDTENLLPFTRWITPEATPKRFTTQMYLYMLPLSSSEDPAIAAAQSEAMIPTPDGGVEHMAARFDDAASWLEKQRKGEIILFPPQCFLLQLMSQFLTGPASVNNLLEAAPEHYASQRERLRRFLDAVPTAAEPRAAGHHTARISWKDKVICPVTLGIRRSDGRTILGLDKPGPELKGIDRGGDWERVVLVKFGKGVARDVEVRSRGEVLAEEREAERAAEASKL
ncbi:hypothetical protein DL769_004662 [Monosporascus sp. CRB-8-3]|nr:hypothetical protein DL769_004662 [Monosporascus sp. CRB-8-3]